MCEAFSITNFPSFSPAGEGFQKPASGGENSLACPVAAPGEVVFPSPSWKEALKPC